LRDVKHDKSLDICRAREQYRRMLLRALIAFAICSSSFASVPFVVEVYGYPGTSIAPGAPAALECFLDSCDTDVTVRVGGLSAPVWRTDPLYGIRLVYFQMPAELPTGPTNVVIVSGGKSSEAVAIVLDAYAPALIGGRIERGLSGGMFSAWSCASGQTPRPGDLVRAYVYGLGATDHLVFAGTASPANPLAKTLATPVVMIGDQKAEVVESVLSPGEIGIYRVTFKVPAIANDVYDVSVAIGDKQTGTDRLAIGNTIASRYPIRGAMQSIQTAYACGGRIGNPGQAVTGDAKNPPVALGGVAVKVRDSRGVERGGSLLYEDVGQVNYILPDGLAEGTAQVTITTADGTTSTGTLRVASVAPQVFMISQYVPAAVIVRLRGGVQTVEQIYKINAKGDPELAPINLGPETDQVYLVLFGTGWRFRNGFAQSGELVVTSLRFVGPGGETVFARASFAGAQGDFAGLDQMNVRIPRSFAGHAYNMFVVVDDQMSGVANGFVFK
jgi:uncharacterized protein (TIGR03437 family)